MNNVVLYFGSSDDGLQSKALPDEKKGDGASLFNMATAELSELKQFSYLIHETPTLVFNETDDDWHSYLSFLEESTQPEKALAVLSLTRHPVLPARFLDAIEKLYDVSSDDGMTALAGRPGFSVDFDEILDNFEEAGYLISDNTVEI